MKICLYTESALPAIGGQELVVDVLAREFTGHGHDVVVLAPNPPRSARGQRPSVALSRGPPWAIFLDTAAHRLVPISCFSSSIGSFRSKCSIATASIHVAISAPCAEIG